LILLNSQNESIVSLRQSAKGLRMSIARKYIPFGSIPPSIYAGCSSTSWCSTDSKENYLVRNPKSSYSDKDFEYRFNTLGYRCPNFVSYKNDLKILSLGCSNTFGVGIKQEDLFHEIVANDLSNKSNKNVVNWNLSIPGASNDYILRMLLLAYSTLNPDLVLINFTFANRREYFSADGLMHRYTPVSKELVEPAFREVHQRLWDLSSDYDDEVVLFRNYSVVKNILKDTPWLCSFCMKDQTDLIKDHIDDRTYVGEMEFWPKVIDLARDGQHVGPKTHKILADKYISKIIEESVIEKILNKGDSK
jgi:hypothetical protein